MSLLNAGPRTGPLPPTAHRFAQDTDALAPFLPCRFDRVPSRSSSTVLSLGILNLFLSISLLKAYLKVSARRPPQHIPALTPLSGDSSRAQNQALTLQTLLLQNQKLRVEVDKRGHLIYKLISKLYEAKISYNTVPMPQYQYRISLM